MPSKPKLIPFYYEQKVSDGRPQRVSVKIFCSQSEKAPLHKDNRMCPTTRAQVETDSC